MSFEALQTQAEEGENIDSSSGTLLGNQAKDLYGPISKFNNQLLKLNMMQQEESREEIRQQAQSELRAQASINVEKKA